jgi:hypothetical protein
MGAVNGWVLTEGIENRGRGHAKYVSRFGLGGQFWNRDADNNKITILDDAF